MWGWRFAGQVKKTQVNQLRGRGKMATVRERNMGVIRVSFQLWLESSSDLVLFL